MENGRFAITTLSLTAQRQLLPNGSCCPTAAAAQRQLLCLSMRQLPQENPHHM